MNRIHVPSHPGLPVTLAIALLAAAPLRAQDFHMLTDFESGAAEYGLGTKWSYSSSGEDDKETKITTSATPAASPAFDASSLGAGQGGSKFCARLGFAMGTKKIPCGTNCFYDPEVRLGTDLKAKDKQVLDLTGATKISFWAKSDRPMKVLLRILTQNVIDDGYYTNTMDMGTEWKEFSLDLKSPAFQQPGWADPKVAFNPKLVYGISFVVSREDNPTLTVGEVSVDAIKLHGWKVPAGEDLPSALVARRTRGESGTHSLVLCRNGSLWIERARSTEADVGGSGIIYSVSGRASNVGSLRP